MLHVCRHRSPWTLRTLAAGVGGQLAEEFAGLGVGDPDMGVGDQRHQAGKRQLRPGPLAGACERLGFGA